MEALSVCLQDVQWIVLVRNGLEPCFGRWKQAAPVVLSEVGIVHEQRAVDVREQAYLFVLGDLVADFCVRFHSFSIDQGLIDRQEVRVVELEVMCGARTQARRRWKIGIEKQCRSFPPTPWSTQ